jgi:uncharacterized protein DUF222/HNH endonuclease
VGGVGPLPAARRSRVAAARQGSRRLRPAAWLLYEHMFVHEDLSALSEEELERELAEQAARVDAGLCRLVGLAAECERRLSWGAEGLTFAGWLAWRCSLLPRQAREHERLGTRLAELPLIRAAFARGVLSYAKASVLVGVAEPATEARLLELAEALTASQLARCVAAYRRVSAAEAADRQESEFLDCFWSEEGWLVLRGRLAAEEGALFLRALEAARDVLRERRRAEEADAKPVPAGVERSAREEPVSRVEAFAALAELALAGRDKDRSGGERYQVVVHVSAETLTADDGDRCELAEGQPLAAETARRLACDASLVEVIEHDGRLLALGRKRRTVSPPLRRALAARDRGCRFPGCDRTRFVDAHHVLHWSRGGETNLENLVLLCRRHHRLVHERGYKLRLDDDGTTRFRNQYGVAVPNAPPRPPPSSPDDLHHQQDRQQLVIDGDTCQNGTGDRMSLPLAVDALISAAA